MSSKRLQLPDKSLIIEAVENVSNGVVISDPHQEDNPLIYVNKAFEDITQYTKEEVLGKNCRFLQGADTDKKEIAKLKKAIQEQKEVRVTLTNYTKNGTKFYNELYLTPIFNTNGKLIYFVGIQNDITQQVLIQKELERYKNYLEEVVKERTKTLQDTNKELREEIEQRQKAQEKIINLNQKLRNYTEKLQSKIQQVQGVQLTKNEKYVTYILTKHSSSLKDLATTFDIPNSTLASIRHRLLGKEIKQTVIPHQAYIPFYTLVQYSEPEEDVRKQLENNTSVCFAVASKETGCYLLATKDWNSYKEAQQTISLKAKKIEIKHSNQTPELFFNFENYLKKLFTIYSDDEPSLQTPPEKLDENDKKVLWGITKYPEDNLHKLAEKIQLSVPTISKKRRKILSTVRRYTPRIQAIAKYLIIGPAQPTSILTIEDTSLTLAKDDIELTLEGNIIPLEPTTYVKLDFSATIKKLYLVE